MAILCRDLNLLFIMVPGTGCSVVGNMLIADFGGEPLPEWHIIVDGRVVHDAKHNSVAQLLRDGLLTAEQLAKLTVVANIRNPYDRIVTYYQRLAGDWLDYSLGVQEREVERGRDKLSEAEYQAQRELLASRGRRRRRRQQFMRYVGFNPWVLATLARKTLNRGELQRFAFPMLQGVHFALRNEMLPESINALFARIGIQRTVELPRANITQGKEPYTTYWNRLSRGIFDGLVGDDIRRYGYKFDGFDPESPLIDLTAAASAPASRRLPHQLPTAK
ncbi:MAG: hypothetical protein JNG89_01030 [Planctomycetaceae bacterium]|nr:hypothetical protein [Planctomycetaceae bacterium]